MLIDHGMSLHYVSGRVMRAGIRSLRVSECTRARVRARMCVCVSPGGYMGKGRIFRARFLEVQGSGDWGVGGHEDPRPWDLGEVNICGKVGTLELRFWGILEAGVQGGVVEIQDPLQGCGILGPDRKIKGLGF